jgi:hypothetical protein
LGNRTVNGTSFVVSRGLRQGCGLFPLLFDLYINAALEEWKTLRPKRISLGNKMYIDSILFVDHKVLMAKSEDELQHNIMKSNQVLQSHDVNISIDKTKAIAMEGRQIRRVKIIINGNLIEPVNSFKYLGCNTATHKMNMNLEENIEIYNKISGIIKRHFGKKNETRDTSKNAQCAEQTSHDV